MATLTGAEAPACEALRAERPADADAIAQKALYSAGTNLLLARKSSGLCCEFRSL